MNDTTASSFPQTRQDLSNLKNTALDAAKDIGSTASVHAKKVQSNLQDLAANAQKEGGEQLGQVKTSLANLGDSARDYISTRPLAAIGVALAVGFIFGSFRSSKNS